MFGTISNDLQKLINDLRKLVLFFTQALYAASLSLFSEVALNSNLVDSFTLKRPEGRAPTNRQLQDAPVTLFFVHVRPGTRSGVARCRASEEAEILHELSKILIDHCGHVIGPMIISFVQIATQGFQSPPADRLQPLFSGSRKLWVTSARPEHLRAGPRSGGIRHHKNTLK
jgi:hypothetical protein